MKILDDPAPEGMSPRDAGALSAQKLGSVPERCPFKPDSEEAGEWVAGWMEATGRLVDLFGSWLALGHSTPLLALGASGQALGPMVAGLIQSNGNAAGPVLVGALFRHEGHRLADILPKSTPEGRRLFEATQWAILGVDLPEELQEEERPSKFYSLAAELELFRMQTSELESDKATGRKLARTSFDLAEFLKVLVKGLPESEEKGGES